MQKKNLLVFQIFYPSFFLRLISRSVCAWGVQIPQGNPSHPPAPARVPHKDYGRFLSSPSCSVHHFTHRHVSRRTLLLLPRSASTTFTRKKKTSFCTISTITRGERTKRRRSARLRAGKVIRLHFRSRVRFPHTQWAGERRNWSSVALAYVCSKDAARGRLLASPVFLLLWPAGYQSVEEIRK